MGQIMLVILERMYSHNNVMSKSTRSSQWFGERQSAFGRENSCFHRLSFFNNRIFAFLGLVNVFLVYYGPSKIICKPQQGQDYLSKMTLTYMSMMCGLSKEVIVGPDDYSGVNRFVVPNMMQYSAPVMLLLAGLLQLPHWLHRLLFNCTKRIQQGSMRVQLCRSVGALMHLGAVLGAAAFLSMFAGLPSSEPSRCSLFGTGLFIQAWTRYSTVGDCFPFLPYRFWCHSRSEGKIRREYECLSPVSSMVRTEVTLLWYWLLALTLLAIWELLAQLLLLVPVRQAVQTHRKTDNSSVMLV